MDSDRRNIQDLVHSRVLNSLVALVSRHDPKLLLRLESDIGRFVSKLPPDKRDAATACFSSFMGGVMSSDFRAGAESLLDGAPDWVRLWLDTPQFPDGSPSLCFELIPRDSAWRVTLEGKLYGVFANRDEAVAAMKGAVENILRSGGHADWFDAII